MSTLTPTGSGRRGPLPVVLAIVLALAIGAAGGWWFAGRSDTGAASPRPTTSRTCTTHPTASGKPVVLPAPAHITVNVYNATQRGGLAHLTSNVMARRGFQIGAVANDPLNKIIPAPAEIRYGPAGAKAAKVVAAQVPHPTMVRDKRKNGIVDLVLGEGFIALRTPAQAHAVLTAHARPTGC